MPHTTLTDCDHCHRPHRALWTHLIPRALRASGPDGRISQTFTSLTLCQGCGAKRRQDLRDFFAGAAPTELVCSGVSR